MDFSKIVASKPVNNGGYVSGVNPTVIRSPFNITDDPTVNPVLLNIDTRYKSKPSGDWMGEGWPTAWVTS